MTATPKSTTTQPASRGIYGVTPDGLTTSVNAPILMSAAEMHQGCVEMQAWAASMEITDPETILAISQLTEEDSTEGFTVEPDEEGEGWATATPSEQAALVKMANNAISGDC
ncbi:lipoprotein LpqV [Rhodococcus sp. IEGM 1409]|uniref:lipoprotein LpqV n=1 Tax=Rhodococcus sp. IEGM 1409 TaxID=3047082 RepID=UPI0024B70F1F|nr:lipoprotein LpqV [Rhodococcus sp. IEGM 1409]MDI9900518.1 lipoprotein LpqV [Rhodococcus sp. IEGM 1409]